jgi:hypothetical protein
MNEYTYISISIYVYIWYLKSSVYWYICMYMYVRMLNKCEGVRHSWFYYTSKESAPSQMISSV